MSELLVASRNPKKLAELHRVLDSAGVALTLLSLDDVAPFDEAPEIGATFEENALAKARDAFRATGLPSVADDSGLEVEALNGMPGVLSARWSGRHGDDAANTALLLAQMADVPDERRGPHSCRRARWSTRRGRLQRNRRAREVAGHHRPEPRGAGGFGYDPVFLPQGWWRTAAELSAEQKDSVSHRGRALSALLPALRELAPG